MAYHFFARIPHFIKSSSKQGHSSSNSVFLDFMLYTLAFILSGAYLKLRTKKNLLSFPEFFGVVSSSYKLLFILALNKKLC